MVVGSGSGAASGRASGSASGSACGSASGLCFAGIQRGDGFFPLECEGCELPCVRCAGFGPHKYTAATTLLSKGRDFFDIFDHQKFEIVEPRTMFGSSY